MDTLLSTQQLEKTFGAIHVDELHVLEVLSYSDAILLCLTVALIAPTHARVCQAAAPVQVTLYTVVPQHLCRAPLAAAMRVHVTIMSPRQIPCLLKSLVQRYEYACKR